MRESDERKVIPLFPDHEERLFLAGVHARVERFLSYRERSPQELRRFCKERLSLSARETALVLEYATEEGFLDERRFAESRLEHRLLSGKGPYWIRRELRSEGIAEELITELLGNLDIRDVLEAGLPKARTKLRSLRSRYTDETEIRERLFRYLQGRGFSYDECKDVYARLCSDEERS